MQKEKESIILKIQELEEVMTRPDFWSDKDTAQKVIKELQVLKDSLDGVGVYDRGNAVMSLLSGVGGDDAEDFTRMLLAMYQKFFIKRNWTFHILDENKNSQGGYRSVSLEIMGKGVYGDLKYENGVHRLVRLSPFNANQKRQTSFSMVEIVPVVDELDEFHIQSEDLDIEFTRSGGPGGQNVNKRETAVRITHKPSGIVVRADGERTQEANKEKALSILRGKVVVLLEEAHAKNQKDFKLSAVQKIEWGNQIRSYVLHPYKLVKDHRTEYEMRDTEKVLERGEVDEFIDAMKQREM